MSELRELYQEMVLDHNSRPRNFKKLEGATHQSEGYNPLCGDRITLYLKMRGDLIEDLGFQGTGCAISRASASMMTQSIKGKTIEQAEEIFGAFHKMVTRDVGEPYDSDDLGDLEVLSGVAEFPARVKCASLSWHTLNAALEGKAQKISTE
ncbi:MAG: SUF system NifU family Fe-S cluster assembly protein [Dehalococcoidia bacterium]|nr:SUF system NifU family Fe-S cluster assembly protein [Dehalococcoidia bacterium]